MRQINQYFKTLVSFRGVILIISWAPRSYRFGFERVPKLFEWVQLVRFVSMVVLEAKGICKKYGALTVLDDNHLSIEAGEVVAIVGSSGAGKSTLLHILGTLDRPDRGQVWLKGKEVFGLSDAALAHFRNTHIGFVFQFHNLLAEFSALENICMPAFIAGQSEKQASRKAEELLERLGLHGRGHHLPSQLSGGEQQRVAVARALMNDPAIVFADEPSGNLDSHNAQELHTLFFNLRAELHQTFVIVTHNESLAELADRRLVMKDGKLI